MFMLNKLFESEYESEFFYHTCTNRVFFPVCDFP